MEVPKQKDIRNEQPELELFPEEATESPEQGQSEMTAEKEPERKSSDERAIRNGGIALRNETMSFIVSYKTMEDAFRKVASNKGSAGVDGITCEELMPYFHKHWQEIRGALLGRTYKPTPVKRVEIPKGGNTEGQREDKKPWDTHCHRQRGIAGSCDGTVMDI